ncbi:MAG: hypothetical protein GC149_15640 [Gammaproteobacteria bacterium]|nr:hypothetical protein [Gammaproteobacteria bacterium]
MKAPNLKLFKIFLSVFILTTTFSACANSDSDSKPVDTVVIADIANWRHPVKKVFAQHKVKLSKVVLTKHKQYPIFYVSFPYDPQSSQTSDYFNQLYAEVLAANGWWSYTLYDDQDKIKIEVNWNKTKKVMTTNFVPLQ